MKLLLTKLLLCLSFVVFVSLDSIHAQESVYVPPKPQDFSQVDFYLQTVGIGPDVYMAFGHTLLRMIDRRTNADVVYNWGVFDFRDPYFIPRFVYGVTRYKVDAMSMRTVLAVYQHEQRSLVQDKLNLTTTQKERLYQRIAWNAKPENVFYRYHYYFDNCSTKVRDYLNEALSGAIHGTFDELPGVSDLRAQVHGHFDTLPLIQLGTEILMNSDLEDHMSAWQEMFLPLSLRKYLLKLPQFDDQGQPLPETSLLSEEQVIYDFVPPQPKLLNGFQLFFFVFAIPIFWAAMLFIRKSFAAVAYRMMGLAAIMWGLFAGFFGTAMVIIWAFFEHVHGRHSTNLWLFWPTDCLYVGYGWYWLKNQSPVLIINRKRRWAKNLALLHLPATIVFCVLFYTGVIEQDVSYIISYQAPLALLIFSLIWRKGFTAAKEAA